MMPALMSSLGPLELQVLETVWSLAPGALLARDVQEAIKQPLAYTTVATTLDRLCKKKLLDRVKADRAFVYRARYTRRELDQMEAQQAIRNLATGGELVSCLIDAVTQEDASLLDELEARIRSKREDLRRKRGAAL